MPQLDCATSGDRRQDLGVVFDRRWAEPKRAVCVGEAEALMGPATNLATPTAKLPQPIVTADGPRDDLNVQEPAPDRSATPTRSLTSRANLRTPLHVLVDPIRTSHGTKRTPNETKRAVRRKHPSSKRKRHDQSAHRGAPNQRTAAHREAHRRPGGSRGGEAARPTGRGDEAAVDQPRGGAGGVQSEARPAAVRRWSMRPRTRSVMAVPRASVRKPVRPLRARA